MLYIVAAEVQCTFKASHISIYKKVAHSAEITYICTKTIQEVLHENTVIKKETIILIIVIITVIKQSKTKTFTIRQ